MLYLNYSGAELISWVKNLKHQLKVAESTMLYVQRLVAEGEFVSGQIFCHGIFLKLVLF